MTEGAGIRIAFAEAVADGLTGSGWRRNLQPRSADDEVAVYDFPLDDEFGLVARFFCYGGEEGHSELDAAVRLSYLPATQVVEALGVVGGDGVTVGVSDLTGEEEPVALVAAGSADARAFGARLADLVAVVGVAWGRRHATVDALVALVVEWEADPHVGRQLFASSVILGAAGRVLDARAALRAELQASGPFAPQREQAEIAGVTRWLAAGASTTPPQARPGRHDTEPGFGSFLGAMGSSFQENRAKRAVRQSVASQQPGKTRDQLRELYETEAGENNLIVDPLSVESFLDTLEIESRSERTRSGLAALAAAVTLIRGTIADITTSARSTSPERFPLPDVAAYPIGDDGEGSRWVLVEIGPEAAGLVDDLVPEPSSLVPTTVRVHGWLSTELVAAGSPPSITVNLDGHHLGVVTAPAAAAFREALELAGTLDLKPFVRLRISRRLRPPLRLIEISAPLVH